MKILARLLLATLCLATCVSCLRLNPSRALVNPTPSKAEIQTASVDRAARQSGGLAERQ
ncbi:MAG TPA: hypothetical protein VHH73_01230 [Verrucomicrobiae bacterium]|nr:hypothetical protein [Verrucomicrobiae bacterium]